MLFKLKNIFHNDSPLFPYCLINGTLLETSPELGASLQYLKLIAPEAFSYSFMLAAIVLKAFKFDFFDFVKLLTLECL